MISATAWTYDMGPADCEEEDSRKHANEFAGFLRWITIALSQMEKLLKCGVNLKEWGEIKKTMDLRSNALYETVKAYSHYKERLDPGQFFSFNFMLLLMGQRAYLTKKYVFHQHHFSDIAQNITNTLGSNAKLFQFKNMGMLSHEHIPRIVLSLLTLLTECPNIIELKSKKQDYATIHMKLDQLRRNGNQYPYKKILVLGAKDMIQLILGRICELTTDIVCVEKNSKVYQKNKEKVKKIIDEM